MANIAAGNEECQGGGGCDTGCCDGGSCADQDCGTCGDSERLEAARAQWEQEFRAELARLQKRVADLEAQSKAHASRQICALMTEIDSLERNVLGRDTTTSQLKKAGMQTLGVDKRP